MIDDELWIYERKFRLDDANFNKELAAPERCAVENPGDALTERGALALFFAD